MLDVRRSAAPDMRLNTGSFCRTISSTSDASTISAVPLAADAVPAALPPPPPAAAVPSVRVPLDAAALLAPAGSGSAAIADRGSSPLVPRSACSRFSCFDT